MKRHIFWLIAAAALVSFGTVGIGGCGATSNGSDGDADSDGDGDTDTDGDSDGDTDTDMTIFDVQKGEVAQDSSVTLTDVVVTTPLYVKDGTSGYIWVSEPEGGPYSGILLYLYSEVITSVTLAPGDKLTVTGTYTEYYDKSEITVSSAAAIEKTGTAAVPTPAVVQPANIITGGADAEAYESVLVRVEDVAVTNADLGYGEFEVTGALPIDDYFFSTGGGPSGANIAPAEGDTFGAIVGVLDYSFEKFKVLPRTMDDYVDFTGVIDTDTDTNPEEVTISQIQQGEVTSGEAVIVADVIVTSPLTYDGEGFFVQDAAGGEYSGIYVYNYNGDTDPAAIAVGDVVTITGEYSEFNGCSEVAIDASTAVVKNGTGTVPAPIAISDSASIATGGADAAKYEGVLVTVSDVSVTTEVNAYGEIIVDDALMVGSMFLTDFLGPAVGETYASITGPLFYSYDNFKVEPRSDADLVQ